MILTLSIFDDYFCKLSYRIVNINLLKNLYHKYDHFR